MVDADDTQRRALGARCQGDWHSGLVEGSGDGIYRDGVVGVCTIKWSDGRIGVGDYNLRISADVANDR